MLEKYALKVPDILLPDRSAMPLWAVVACDQFTSQKEYWEEVKNLVGDAPSTLNLIYPEAWLDQGEKRIGEINRAMAEYEKSVLTRRFHGMALVEREVGAGKRLGLVAAVDLEKYDFAPDAQSLIRATEGTILERIPPRVRIRRDAPLELPHILLLADDPEGTLIEPLYAGRADLEPLYDFELMMGGGRVRGWLVEDEKRIEAALDGLLARSRGLLLAVGDGNHSLATARQCWLEARERLSEEERENHPARYALVEINNLHDPALVFEPIHRVVFGAEEEALQGDFAAWLRERDMTLEDAEGGQGMFAWARGKETRPRRIGNCRYPLPLKGVQDFLDEWLAGHPRARVDYIHGEEAARALAAEGENTGILLPAMDKNSLFEAVRRGGPLPRKAFSMGEAREKRYYLECRRIRED